MKLNNIIKCIKIPFEYSEKYYLSLIISGIFSAIIFNIATYLLSVTINIATKQSDYGTNLNIFLISIYLLSMGGTYFISNWQTYLKNRFKAIIYLESKQKLYLQKFDLPYVASEKSENLDLFNTLANFEENILNFIDATVFLITLFLKLSLLFVMIAYFSVTTSIIALIFTVISVALVIKGGNASYNANKKVQSLEREYNAIKKILVSQESCEERKVFNFRKYLLDTWHKKYEESRTYKEKAFLIWFIKAQFGGIAFILLTIGIIAILLFSLMNNNLTFGFFVALLTTFIGLNGAMSWDLSDNIDKFIKSLLINNDYLKFTELEKEDSKEADSKETESRNKENLSNKFQKLVVKDVKFSYPDTDKIVLKNISVQFEKNKKYAIVGTNGSGKTTLIKIILGLYNNYQGEVSFYNKENNVIDLPNGIGGISVVFQDFAKYYISFRDYLKLAGDLTVSDEEILRIFSDLKLDIDIDTLPKGLDTPLGTVLEEGINLSGGQWQKLCLARALLSDANIIILDEPTAALDPISEVQIFKDFETLCKNKTVIYISHRLGATKNVDEIILINNGVIYEKGTHDALMDLDGMYKEMYDSQKSWYVKVEDGDDH